MLLVRHWSVTLLCSMLGLNCRSAFECWLLKEETSYDQGFQSFSYNQGIGNEDRSIPFYQVSIMLKIVI